MKRPNHNRKYFAAAFLVIGLLASCSRVQNDRIAVSSPTPNIITDSRYPALWFTPINDPNKPDWEILPQDAGPGEVILSKRNEVGLLSNFAPTPFVFHNRRYASLEGFWQMMLYPEGPNDPRAKFPGIEWQFTREQVGQMTAFDAKTAGTLAEENMAKMGIDWATFEGKRFPYRSVRPGEHYRLIAEATRAKVDQNPEVKRVLLATGDIILKPDHHGEENPPPEWKYYDLLTQIRTELQRSPR
ncbi:MAG TPA: NADAR family protein [Pyrinomonadaceae bacterium]|nr:NADAR family protein [Pyrinomonadaceae bacterium]